MLIRHRAGLRAVPRHRPATGNRSRQRADVFLTFNESPYPLLAAVRDALVAVMDSAHRYPDFAGVTLIEQLAEHWHVQRSQVTIDGGSSGVIRSIASVFAEPGTTAVFGWLPFPVYEQATPLAGAQPNRVPLDSSYRLDLPAISRAVDDRARVVFLCLPNNPTGMTVSQAALRAFMASVPRHLLVVVDECYGAFVTAPDADRGCQLLADFSNLVVLKSFSKSAGLAGLRAGHALSSPEVAELLRLASVPFGVSIFAQAAAVAALSAPALKVQRGRVAEIVSECDRVHCRLRQARVAVVESEANFLYVTPRTSAGERIAHLARCGIHVRHAAADPIRISIGSSYDHDRLLEHIDLLMPSFP
ncbi:aminotransferase class I/II-fold pyridoxal phosphate-dependent enzyme [Nocardia sp. NPDC051981]|uniref:aminotransferase class I/II-fold pyridoxal phosphate-dependent enzyme n=1 Tax=Nocardia sp. NPDC051981 TaxID=3155417 RepID=UPI0034423C6A